MLLLTTLLILCLISATTLICQHCLRRGQLNTISQLSILATLVLSLLSPLMITIPTHGDSTVSIFADRHLRISLYYDALTYIMLCLVSFISLMIHSYAARYLLSDINQKRFMAQLSLLTFSVMLLVMSGNLLTAFIAWQFIGLSLYLLLNHYHYDLKANKAAKKKFMINRVGDICFLLAVIIALHQYGYTTFETFFKDPEAFNPLILGLIIVAIMTKSAQFPFHIWLIDTMEAPTPVSALMHAGVINAGGFLLARLSPLYLQAPILLMAIFVIGLITALLGTFFMQHQADTKKQLAYSTMGQMGYMLMQCGLGCFTSAVFHLIAHGFFKATLFLSSGSTLIQSNQPAHRLPQISQSIASLISLGLILLLITMGMHFEHELNPVMWLFIAITLFQLFYPVCLGLRQGLTAIMSIISISGVYGAYLFTLNGLENILDDSLKQTPHHTLSWVIAAGILGIVVFCLTIKRILPDAQRIKLAYCLYGFGFSKGRLESWYRRYLVNPLRHWGDILLDLFSRLNTITQYAVPLVILGYLLGNILIPLFFSASTFTTGLMAISSNILLLLVFLLMANRVSSLIPLGITLVFSVLATTCIAFGVSDQDMQVIGIFQCLNNLLTLGGFMLLSSNRRPRFSNKATVQNRLPWRHFYMSIFLMLLIGIPGTASFISELYLIYGLITNHVALAVIFSIAMLVLTLVVLHALQVHIFRPEATNRYATPVGPMLHGICVGLIGLNIYSGFYPMPVLRGISQILGG